MRFLIVLSTLVSLIISDQQLEKFLSHTNDKIRRRALAPIQTQVDSLANNDIAIDKENKSAWNLAENFTGEYAGAWVGTLPKWDTRPLFYNFVPHTGKEILVLLMQWLQGYNGFKHIHLPHVNDSSINTAEQIKLAQMMKDMSEVYAVPCSYDRNAYFVNFTSMGEQMPIYINLLRNPLEKAKAQYFHHFRFENSTTNLNISKEEQKTEAFENCVRRKDPECQFITGIPYDLTIPYFCGNDEHCKILNDKQALEQSKINLENHFAVVGILEDINVTLAVLEHVLPFYFSGVSHMFHKELLVPTTKINVENPSNISRNVEEELKKNLTMEYELYQFAVQRLYRQFKSIPEWQLAQL